MRTVRKEGRVRRSALEREPFKQLPQDQSTSATNVSAEEPFHTATDARVPRAGGAISSTRGGGDPAPTHGAAAPRARACPQEGTGSRVLGWL